VADIDLRRCAGNIGALWRVSLIAHPQEVRTIPPDSWTRQARPTTCFACIIGGGAPIVGWRKGLRRTAGRHSEYEEGEET
jgi:hypothetical protein